MNFVFHAMLYSFIDNFLNIRGRIKTSRAHLESSYEVAKMARNSLLVHEQMCGTQIRAAVCCVSSERCECTLHGPTK